MNTFAVSTDQQRGHTVITLHGDLDNNAWQALEEHLAGTTKQPGHLIIDLTGVTFLDTMSLGLLTQTWKRVTGLGDTFLLVGATRRTARALWITGLHRHIPHVDTLEQAMQTLPCTPEPSSEGTPPQVSGTQ